MKNSLVIVIAFLIGLQLTAQELTVTEDKIHSFVQEKASPINGFEDFYQAFASEFDITAAVIKQDEVTFKVKLVIEKDGSFSNIQFLGDDYGYKEETKRVLYLMPYWKPAKHKDTIVRSYFTLPIKLKKPTEPILSKNTVVETKKAEPKEGLAVFMNDFVKQFKYDKKAVKKAKEFSFRLVFYIEKDGSLTDIQVIEDEFNVGQDAVRIMKLMPSWNPAMHNGYIVRSRFTIPIKIRVN